jgi:hypothetical protein
MLMSPKSKIIFVALAAAVTLGAAQIAASQASTASLADRFEAISEFASAGGINRVAKGDRAASVPHAAGPARTVVVTVGSLADTSVLVRIPREKQARNLAPAVPTAKPAGDRVKRMTACEPPVSVLTEVAKLLQPGKCVT